VTIINTCTVTDTAEKEVRSLISSARKNNPGGRIVVTGCLATVGSDVFQALGEHDSVVPPGQRKDLMNVILNRAPAKEFMKIARVIKRSERHTSADIDEPLSDALPSPEGKVGELPMRKRFHLRVQEGCDNFCTFCIIPSTRGKVVSRSPERIIWDLKQLASLGYEEIVLTGTHLGGYGQDIDSSLQELLYTIASAKLVNRVRLSSLDPDDVNRALIDIIAENEIFCGHLHLCLQALDDLILKRMNRGYRLAEAVELLEYARKRLPSAALGTDLITGFPGESEQLFEKQCSRFDEIPLNYVHVFPYSERAGTAAVRLEGEVEAGERKRRSARWRALAGRRYREFGRSFVGREVEMVVESLKERDDGLELRGTTREFVDAQAFLARSGEAPQLGRCVRLRAAKFDEAGETLQCG